MFADVFGGILGVRAFHDVCGGPIPAGLKPSATDTKPAQAGDSVALCVQSYLDMGNMEALADTIVIAADLAQIKSDRAGAAVLLGAAQQIYRTYHFRRDIVEGAQAEYLQRCIDSVRAQMGEAAFARAFEAGQILATPEAAKLAIES